MPLIWCCWYLLIDALLFNDSINFFVKKTYTTKLYQRVFISKFKRKKKNSWRVNLKFLSGIHWAIWYVNWFCATTFVNNISIVYHSDVGRLLWQTDETKLHFWHSTLSFKPTKWQTVSNVFGLVCFVYICYMWIKTKKMHFSARYIVGEKYENLLWIKFISIFFWLHHCSLVSFYLR